jgi:hypothetical protein
MALIRSRWQSVALIAILFLGLALRLAPWGQNRFLEDEALYAAWGRQIATGADPMLDMEPVDKPPLHPYILALSFWLSAPFLSTGVGAGQESAARLPSLLASMASIVLVYALALQLPSPVPSSPPRGKGAGTEGAALLAALLLALSPFDILFASTAFTDPLMTAFVLAALLAATTDHLGAGGLLLGLAAATKQQGLFFLPLVVVTALLSPRLPAATTSDNLGDREGKVRPVTGVLTRLRRIWAQRWVRFALALALVAVGVLCWDAARAQRPGFLQQSLISYGRLAPAGPAALVSRAAEWLRLAASFWVSPWFNALLLATIGAWFLGGLACWWRGPSRIDLAFGVFVVAFLLLHWLVSFQVWDRYLLGLVPLVALLAARAFVAVGHGIRVALWRRVYAVGLGLFLAVSLAGPVVQAARSELPMGGDHGAYDGIEELANYMRTQAPAGSVLYDHWLGYHYRFYLFGAPLRIHWYPDLGDLAHDATVYRREPRYIAFPSWRDSAPDQTALAEAGIHLVPLFQTTRRDGTMSFRLYRLEGP